MASSSKSNKITATAPERRPARQAQVPSAFITSQDLRRVYLGLKDVSPLLPGCESVQHSSALLLGGDDDRELQQILALDCQGPQALNSLRQIYCLAAVRAITPETLRAFVELDARLDGAQSEFCTWVSRMLDHGIPPARIESLLAEEEGISVPYRQICLRWVEIAIMRHVSQAPVVAQEDNWPAGDGYPRWVRCHQCHHWREWRYICEKGALEGRPVGDGLECWWCYTQRMGGGVTWGEVKKLFARLYAKDRGHRVAQWQNLLWYVTDPEVENSAAKPAEARYRTKKRAYDDLRAEQTAFRNDGGGSANIDDLNVDDKVKFKSKDQYVGINDVEFEGIECVLFNWASTTNRTKKNAAMATLANKETKDVITKGRALEGHIAAHNLCVVTDSCAVGAIRQQFDAAQAYSAFAIGGEYRDPTDKRGEAEHYCGIQLMGLKRHKHKPCETWSSVEWTVLQRLIRGDHPGAVEGRSKCIRPTDGRGIAE